MTHTPCHICGSTDVRWQEDFPLLPRVTSDCRPWPAGGKLGTCPACRTVIKGADAVFIEECRTIYEKYEVYYQAKGAEQRVFEQQSGLSATRSELILKRFLETNPLPPAGRLLDVGCGNGNLLRSFTKLMPEWLLSGHELDEKSREAVMSVRNAVSFHSGDLDAIEERFDVVTLIHCLEHIVHPLAFLAKIGRRLAEGGHLLIQVPDHTRNPFDLVIADHCSHFDPESLRSLLAGAGFRVVYAAATVPRELTIAAVREDNASLVPVPSVDVGPYRDTDAAVRWLAAVADDARAASGARFGIFGTSISGIWLYNAVGEKVSFFVDEDTNRIGRSLLGREIIAPASLTPSDVVYLPFPYPFATDIHERMRIHPAAYRLPPGGAGESPVLFHPGRGASKAGKQ